jgi:alanine racemase
MIRPTVARIDLDALKSNYRHIVEYLQTGSRSVGSGGSNVASGFSRTSGPPEGGHHVPPEGGHHVPPEGGRHVPPEGSHHPPGVIAVVKANAYGHGAPQVALALEDAGADLVACADIEEGTALRAAGVRAEILVFGALSVSDLDGLFDCTLTPTISTPGAALAVQAAAARYKRTLRYHLKIDTGMNRLGFRFDNLRRTLPDLFASPNLELAAIYTHFATADDPESPLFNEQRVRFERTLGDIGELVRGAHPSTGSGRALHRESLVVSLSNHETSAAGDSRRPYIHAANSAAVLRDSRVWYDRVRPGLLLYGVVPPPLASTIALTPVMTLGSRVVAVKGVRPGEGVGYGVKFKAETPTTIAIVPAGYADGLDMRLAGGGSVLIRGRRAPIIASVCMDMLIADVTAIDASPGDDVVIIGRQGSDCIDVREMAAQIGTIPYEILCRIGSRIERVYSS